MFYNPKQVTINTVIYRFISGLLQDVTITKSIYLHASAIMLIYSWSCCYYNEQEHFQLLLMLYGLGHILASLLYAPIADRCGRPWTLWNMIFKDFENGTWLHFILHLISCRTNASRDTFHVNQIRSNDHHECEWCPFSPGLVPTWSMAGASSWSCRPLCVW